MIFDLVWTAVLTACATILVALFLAEASGSASRRLRLAVGMAIWFATIVAIGASGGFGPSTMWGTIGLGLSVLTPVAVFSIAATRPTLIRTALLQAPLELLIAVNILRIAGVCMALLYMAGRLPAPFGLIAGWGDVLIGVAAIPVAMIVRVRAMRWRGLVLAWNSLGLLDLVVAVALGALSASNTPFRLFHAVVDTREMTGLPWLIIPGFLVPLLILTHLAIFARLRGASVHASTVPACPSSRAALTLL